MLWSASFRHCSHLLSSIRKNEWRQSQNLKGVYVKLLPLSILTLLFQKEELHGT